MVRLGSALAPDGELQICLFFLFLGLFLRESF